MANCDSIIWDVKGKQNHPSRKYKKDFLMVSSWLSYVTLGK